MSQKHKKLIQFLYVTRLLRWPAFTQMKALTLLTILISCIFDKEISLRRQNVWPYLNKSEEEFQF